MDVRITFGADGKPKLSHTDSEPGEFAREEYDVAVASDDAELCVDCMLSGAAVRAERLAWNGSSYELSGAKRLESTYQPVQGLTTVARSRLPGIVRTGPQCFDGIDGTMRQSLWFWFIVSCPERTTVICESAKVRATVALAGPGAMIALTGPLSMEELPDGSRRLHLQPGGEVVPRLVGENCPACDCAWCAGEERVNVSGVVTGGSGATKPAGIRLENELDALFCHGAIFAPLSPLKSTDVVYGLRVGAHVRITHCARGGWTPDGMPTILIDGFSGVRVSQFAPGARLGVVRLSLPFLVRESTLCQRTIREKLSAKALHLCATAEKSLIWESGDGSGIDTSSAQDVMCSLLSTLFGDERETDARFSSLSSVTTVFEAKRKAVESLSMGKGTPVNLHSILLVMLTAKRTCHGEHYIVASDASGGILLLVSGTPQLDWLSTGSWHAIVGSKVHASGAQGRVNAVHAVCHVSAIIPLQHVPHVVPENPSSVERGQPERVPVRHHWVQSGAGGGQRLSIYGIVVAMGLKQCVLRDVYTPDTAEVRGSGVERACIGAHVSADHVEPVSNCTLGEPFWRLKDDSSFAVHFVPPSSACEPKMMHPWKRLQPKFLAWMPEPDPEGTVPINMRTRTAICSLASIDTLELQFGRAGLSSVFMVGHVDDGSGRMRCLFEDEPAKAFLQGYDPHTLRLFLFKRPCEERELGSITVNEVKKHRRAQEASCSLSSKGVFVTTEDHRAAIKLVKEACSGPARLVHIRRRPFPSQHGPQWEIRAAWRHEAYGHFPIFFLPD